jgi:cytochrome c oxidase subunit 3
MPPPACRPPPPPGGGGRCKPIWRWNQRLALIPRSFSKSDNGPAGHEISFVYGVLNTAILMTSSLTMALAERACEARRLGLARIMLAATLALGLSFLVVKGFEYREDFEKRLFPNADFALQAQGARLFFALYWVSASFSCA